VPGSLSTLNNDIPRTIRDSFFLCKQLKERYIWVDSLCIIQNSPVDKYAQIAHMDQIYHDALLTVVGAAGDAKTGLPGVTDTMRKTTQLLASFHDMKFSAAPDTTNNLLANSPWSFRGWTLQEQVLSRRLLVFTDRMVFFNCRDAIFREDIESKAAMGDIVLMDPIEKSVVRAHGSLVNLVPSPYQPRPKEILLALQEYAELVYDYMNRSLSNEEDILNAFTGVLKTFIPTLGAFRFGMPLNFLGITLLIFQVGPGLLGLQENSISTFRSGLTTRSSTLYSTSSSFGTQTEFLKYQPAWSQPEYHPNSTWIKGLKNNADLFNKTSYSRSKYTNLRRHYTNIFVRLPLVPFEPAEDEAHLYEICGNDGEYIGRVFLADSWRKSQPDRLEFALMGVRELGHVSLAVIVVERKDGIARRVQSTFLKQKDWIDASPKRKLILLA
jgi:hypothetical protein